MSDVYDLAARQHGVFTTSQALVVLGSRRRLDTLRGRGVVETVHPEVHRIRGVEPTWRSRLMGATLSVPGSLASHRSAAALRGVWDPPPSRPEIVVERWSRRHRGPDGIIIHETKDLVAGDIDEWGGIPCTSLVRTLVDLPAVVHEFRAGEALDRAHRRDPSILPRVAARHREVARRGRNGTVKLRLLLAERGLGEDKVDSGFERKALRLIANSSLPRPVTQFQVRDGDFVAYLDIAWPDRLVAMECDSIEHHLSVRAFRWERERRRRLLRLGWTILEFTYVEVTRAGPTVVRELEHHLL